MQVRATFVHGTLVVTNDNGGYVFVAGNWPKRVNVHHFLQALCGNPSEFGWYPYHEQDDRWLTLCLELVAKMPPDKLSLMSIADHARLDSCGDMDRSLIAAASIAVLAFEKAYKATRVESQMLVRMNLGVGVPA